MTKPTPRRALIPIARDGWRFTLPLVGLGLILLILSLPKVAIFVLFVALAVALFFRDPSRATPSGAGLIVSPADGKVISVQEVDVETAPGRFERLRRVQIFLSIFNVHIQRSPAAAEVCSVKYNPGKFINALNDKASDENEHNIIWMQGEYGTIGVKQIAGIIARRVVCWCRPGQHLAAGQRLGLIRFGSRTEAYFPVQAEIRTFVGQKVSAGLTILAEIPQPVEGSK